ncbi:MAG: sensor histidine kinase [Kiloniellales bacterium]
MAWHSPGQEPADSAKPNPSDQNTGVALEVTPHAEPTRWLLNLNLSYEDMLRSVVDWLWEANAQLVLTHASPLRSDVRIPAPLEVGNSLSALGDVAEEQPALPPLRDILAARQSFRDAHFIVLEPDERQIACRLTGVPFFDRRNGQFLGYRGTGSLVAAEQVERPQAEADKRLLSLLEHALARKDQLEWELSKAGHRTFQARLEATAHELRTPLNAIIGFAEIIKTQALGDNLDRYIDYGADIYESGVHMVSLVNNLVDLARIESSRDHLKQELLDARKIVASAMRMLEEQAGEKGVKLVNHLSRQLPLLRSERQALRQIFLNLLSNGIKYTRPGGAVGVEADPVSDEMVNIVVWDTGIGIPPEEQERIFERSYRIQGAANAGMPGSGLGLSISRDLARAMGGDISVISRPGQGARFIVRLPAAEESPDQPDD